ncbi:MAG: hypothetical protein HYY01_10965 [Chloroflexi bacterium]|nr:hypothetical protein [Chloroflexota bacterium]
MSSRRSRPNRPDGWLEQDLLALGRQMEYPPSPDVTTQVRYRLLQRQARTRHPRLMPQPTAWHVAVAMSLLVLVLGATLALIPASREALARLFGLERIQVVPDSHVPTPSPGAETPTTLTGATTLAQARSQVDFPIMLPSYPEGLGVPDGVYVQELGSHGEVQLVLRFSARPGLPIQPPRDSDALFTLYQFRTTGMFTKGIPSGTRLEETSINDARGFWLEGDFHLLRYRTADGREVVEMERVVKGNTLAWEVGGITYRLETELPLEEARNIAESLTPGP